MTLSLFYDEMPKVESMKGKRLVYAVLPGTTTKTLRAGAREIPSSERISSRGGEVPTSECGIVGQFFRAETTAHAGELFVPLWHLRVVWP
jgi:hypothetical protein